MKEVPFKELFAVPFRNGLTRPKAVRGTGVKMVNMGEIFAHAHIRDIEMDRVPLSEEEAANYLLEPGDLLFARQSLVFTGAGKCSVFRGAGEPVTFESHIIRARLNPELADPLFYFYFFNSPQGRTAIESIVEQVAAAGIRGSDLANLQVPWFPVPEQRAIAHILGTLDDKIELNRRMNETLEAIARAIFKSWFVDFDPVIDNALKADKPIPDELEQKATRRREVLARVRAEGRPAGLPEHLARLFPNEFEESVFGWIPKGWRVGQLAEILREVVSGSRPKGGAVEAGVPSIGAENVLGLGKYDYSKEKYIPRGFFEKLKRKGASVRDGDVLLYKDGAQVGRKTYFSGGFPYKECAVNEHVFVLRCREVWMQRFLFFWLDQDWMTHEIIALNSNSAQPGINKKGVQSLPILIPQSVTVKAFDELVEPIVDKIFANCHESRTLAVLRDVLLPKLVSGEIRVRIV